MALRRDSGIPQCNTVTRMHFATIVLVSKQLSKLSSNQTAHGAISLIRGLANIICGQLWKKSRGDKAVKKRHQVVVITPRDV